MTKSVSYTHLQRTGRVAKGKILAERKGFGGIDANFEKQILRLHILGAAGKDHAVGLNRDLGGEKEEGLQCCFVNKGHRRPGRDAFRLAGGIVEGIGGIVIGSGHAHAGIRVKNGGTFTHDDEIGIIGDVFSV